MRERKTFKTPYRPQANTMTNVLIGTSGWYYDHWDGLFYPAGLAKSKRLEFYCRHFHTVELNSTFYHLPKVKTTEHWLNDTPPAFRFAIKASRIITHIKKLEDPERSIKALFATIGPLRPKCAAVLFQLPPSLAPDCSLLEDFFSLLPEGWTHAIEFRNRHCYSDRTLAVLEKHGIAFCIHDYGKRPSPAVATCGTVYYRFHGPDGHYGGDYSREFLTRKAGEIRKFLEEGRRVLGYFNNDFNCFAVKNAQELTGLLTE